MVEGMRGTDLQGLDSGSAEGSVLRRERESVGAKHPVFEEGPTPDSKDPSTGTGSNDHPKCDYRRLGLLVSTETVVRGSKTPSRGDSLSGGTEVG